MRGLRSGVLVLLASVAVAGCGSSTPSAASPASLAPASSLLYLELTVRPQGAQREGVESALTRLIGRSPDAAIQRVVGRIFQRAGLNYAHDIQPWLGQRIALVVTGLSQSGLGLVAPTSDPGDALSALRRLGRASHLSAATYAGVHYQTGEVGGTPIGLGIVGQAAVIASEPVFQDIVDAEHGRSLTHTGAFSSAFGALPSGALIKGYVAAGRLASTLGRVFQALPSTGGSARFRQVFAGALSRLHGALSFSLSAAPRSLSLDFRSSAHQHRQPADVSRLPGQSWLAWASSSFNPSRIGSLLELELRQNPAAALALARVRARTGLDVIHDVLPALGPFQIAIQGTSPIAVGAGIVVRPSDPAAASRALRAIRRLVSRNPGLSVQGAGRSFTVTKAGLPIPQVVFTQTGQRLVITVDESAAQALSPSSHLSGSPRFTSARSQLPAGSRVPFFLDFRTLSELLGGLPSFTSNPRDRGVLKVLERLEYLVVGSNPTQSQGRVVLGLR